MADIEIRQGQQIDLDIGRTSDPIQLNLGAGSRTIDLDIKSNSGITDYNLLTGKPKINGVTIQGEKHGPDYRLQNKMDTLTIQEVEKIFYVEG